MDDELDPKFMEEIMAMAEQINQLQRQSARLLMPEVDSVIRNKITDGNTAQHLLDRLLDCAPCDEGLALFKRFLRYYYPIDPETVAFYINAYREMYDGDCQTEEDA